MAMRKESVSSQVKTNIGDCSKCPLRAKCEEKEKKSCKRLQE
jgi:hypothetical protein